MPSKLKVLEHGRLLPEFIAARGLAAVWIVVAHTLAAVMQGYGGVPGPIEYTRVVVDFFFIQSGFVLAHIYDPAWRAGRFRYSEFLARRLTRLWPLHVATLLAVAALILAGRLFGLTPGNTHDARSFAVTLFMLHSAWMTPDLAWNWPSWSVSAEWFAYLAIPLFFLAADRVRSAPARIAVGLGVFVAFAAVSELALGKNLIELTFDGGAFRIVPSFLAGILLRRMFETESALSAMTLKAYAAVVGGVFIVSATLATSGVSYDALWPLALVLVAALAARSMNDDPGLLRGRALAWLGDLS
ncbi:MAG: acyltransferase, partial [Hansschlegelia sp.]